MCVCVISDTGHRTHTGHEAAQGHTGLYRYTGTRDSEMVTKSESVSLHGSIIHQVVCKKSHRHTFTFTHTHVHTSEPGVSCVPDPHCVFYRARRNLRITVPIPITTFDFIRELTPPHELGGPSTQLVSLPHFCTLRALCARATYVARKPWKLFDPLCCLPASWDPIKPNAHRTRSARPRVPLLPLLMILFFYFLGRSGRYVFVKL